MKVGFLLFFLPFCLFGQAKVGQQGEGNSGELPSLYIRSGENMLKKDEAILAEVQLHLKQRTASVSLFMPKEVKKGRLEIVEKETGRILKYFSILMRGWTTMEFEIQSFGPIEFNCRLVMDEGYSIQNQMIKLN